MYKAIYHTAHLQDLQREGTAVNKKGVARSLSSAHPDNLRKPKKNFDTDWNK
jgi:hypothetical protein